MRRPVVEPLGEQLHLSEILVRLADALGLIPAIPQSLMDAASKDRMTFGMELMKFIQENPKAIPDMPYVLAKTLGVTLGSPNLAAIWGTAPGRTESIPQGSGSGPGSPRASCSARRYSRPSSTTRKGSSSAGSIRPKTSHMITHEDGKIHVHIPEMADWVNSIDARIRRKGPAARSSLPPHPPGRPPHEHERQHPHARPCMECRQTGMHPGHAPR